MRRFLSPERIPGPALELPQELKDFEVMRDIPCSWPDLQATPIWVRERYWEYLQQRRSNDAARLTDSRPDMAASTKERPTIGEIQARQAAEAAQGVL